MCLHLGLNRKAMILEEFEVQPGVLACGRDEASSQVRDDPKWWGFACIFKCLFMSCM